MAGSIRQRGQRSWELRVHAGRDPETGRKRYVTKTVRSTKREAERELARLVAQVDDGLVTVSGRTVGQLCERWFAQALPDLSPTVGPQYRRLLDRHILPRWGKVPLRRVRPADLDAWYAGLRQHGGQGSKPLAPNSVQRIHGVLHRALNQAVKWGWLATNPASKASPPRARRAPLTPPAPVDVVRLIDTAAKVNAQLPSLLRLAAATGARRGELCGVQWRDIDFDRGQLLISRSVANVKGRLIVKDTKTHAARRLSLDEGTMATLVEARTHRLALLDLAGLPVEPTAFVFSHELDGHLPWRPDYVTLAFTRLRNELDLGAVRFHDLRHFVATTMLAGGADVKTVSGRLGHADASTTLNVYAHFLEAPDRVAAAQLGSLLDQQRR